MTDRPTDDRCPTCDRIRGVTPTRITQLNCPDDWHDRPTDDLPARLDKMADLSASPAYAAIHRTAAARIRDLEAEVARLTALGEALAKLGFPDRDRWYGSSWDEVNTLMEYR